MEATKLNFYVPEPNQPINVKVSPDQIANINHKRIALNSSDQIQNLTKENNTIDTDIDTVIM